MKHLTDEQLSALLDDALPAGERAECDAHLAGCDACRTRLAEVSALDASLGKALTHDPGEAYFADFAERVAKRIAAEPSPMARARSASPWSWLTSPRGLALAGSTAALLVTAGIAWMRFHSEASAPALFEARSESVVGSRVGKPAASSEVDAARPQPPPAPATRPAPRLDAAATPRDAARARQLQTLANGEQVPVGPPAAAKEREAEGNAGAAPVAGSALAQMKRKSVQPAAGAAATAQGVAEEVTGADKSQTSAGAPVSPPASQSQPAPSPAVHAPTAPSAAAPSAAKFAQEPTAPPAAHTRALALDTARHQSFNEWGATKSLYKSSEKDAKQESQKLTGLAATCGTVRDSRGRALAGSQVTAMHDGVRSTRTGTDGAFCIPGLESGDTLTVMHVGFEPVTVVMTPMTSLAIALEPVGTLGPQSTMLTGKAPTPPSAPSFMRAFGAASDSAIAPAPDVYAHLSFGVQQLARDARAATAVAAHERTAPAWETAAKQWMAVIGQVKGAPAYDARFHYVAALREAYRVEATAERAGRLRSSLSAFLATAPATLPERATVERWQAELGAPTGR